MAGTPDVIVVGAGVIGCGTAYWLTKAGYKVLVLEQEAIAWGASGMAAAMLESVGHGAHLHVQDPLADLAQASFAQHQEFAHLLPEESGIDTGYREQPVIHAAFSAEERDALKSQVLDMQRYHPAVQWLDGQDLRAVEPRLNRRALGGMVLPQAQILAYQYVLALAGAAERRGMTLRHGKVIGLENHAGCITGVRLQPGETIAADTVVLALGAWGGQAAQWLGLRVPIYPVRGQLLKLRVPEPPLQAALAYQGMYVIRKADGVTLAGATEEHDSGFANHPTPEGRRTLLDAALHLAPSLGEAEVIGQISGLRPGTADGLPLIGPVPGWQGLYMIGGHFRSGMLLSAYSTRIIAELIAQGQSPLAIQAFNPSRFGPQTPV